MIRVRRLVVLTSLSILMILFGGCHSRRAKSVAVDQPLFYPSKDEVARVEGKPITLSGFLAIQAVLKKSRPKVSPDEVLSVAVATLTLQQISQVSKPLLSMNEAFQIVLYAWDYPRSEKESKVARLFWKGSLPRPSQARQEIEQISLKFKVYKNTQLLAKLP